MNIDKDMIAKMAVGTWVPPIKKLPTGHPMPTYAELMDHHNKETAILFKVIRELASRLHQADCSDCGDRGFIETGNNDLPCESCDVGRDLVFGGGRTGKEILMGYNGYTPARWPKAWGPKP